MWVQTVAIMEPMVRSCHPHSIDEVYDHCIAPRKDRLRPALSPRSPSKSPPTHGETFDTYPENSEYRLVTGLGGASRRLRVALWRSRGPTPVRRRSRCRRTLPARVPACAPAGDSARCRRYHSRGSTSGAAWYLPIVCGFLNSSSNTMFLLVVGRQHRVHHSPRRKIGGFNRSSQHVQFDWPASTGPELRREFSIRGSCGAVY